MKRLIAALGIGWGLIYATNHLLLPRTPTESKVAVQFEQTSTNGSINSWGPYLSDVKGPEPSNMAQTSLKSRQTQEPAASEAELMQLSSRGIIDHAKAVALEERTLHVARVENPPTSAVRQHDGSPSSLQDLKPNSEADASEDRTLQVARVENPPTSAVRQHDGSASSLQALKPNSEAVALEDRTVRVARVETSAVRQHDGSQSSLQDLKPNSVQSSLQDLKPNSEAVALEDRTVRVARVENPPTSAVQHDGIQSSLQDNSEADASEDRTLRVARVENPPTSAVRQHDGIQSSAQDIKPKSEAIASAERTGNRSVENPPTLSRKTTKPRSPVTPKARIAKAPADQDLPWRVASAPQRRGVGLFIFAPPGF